MKLLFGWLLLIVFILYAFYYVNLNLEKTVAVNDLIKLSEDSSKVSYSAQNANDNNEVFDFDITEESEIIYVAGHKLLDEDNKSNTIDLTIDRPNENVVLILNSKQKITWNIKPSNETNIELIVYDGFESKVLSKTKVLKYNKKLEFTLEKENISFLKLLNSLNKLTNIRKISNFYAKKELPSSITIDTVQNDKKLSLDYLKAKKVDKNINFHLISKSNEIIDFDLFGPKSKDLEKEFIVQDSVISPDRKKVYKIMKNGLIIIDRKTKKMIHKPIPVIKKIYKPRGLAYDSLSDMIYLANNTGKFYVFDAEHEKWIAIRKYINDYDINSFSYDEINNTYVASTWKKESLLFFDQKGNFSTKHILQDKLLGLNYHYKSGDEIPRLHVIAKGENVVIIYIKDFVQKIWYYDKLNRKAYLTYNFYNG